MSFRYNRIDLALVSKGPEDVIEIGETGGAPCTHLVVEKEGGGSVTIEGAAKADGAWDYTLTVIVPTDGIYRERVPLNMPKYVRLAAEGAELSIRG